MRYLLMFFLWLSGCSAVEQTPVSKISYFPDNHTKMPTNTAAQIDAAWAYVYQHANDPACGAILSKSTISENRINLLLEIHQGYVPCKDQSKTGFCWGLSYVDAQFSELALTKDGIIHALPHELFHHWLFWARGDADSNHTNPCWNTIEAFSFTGNEF